MRNKVEIYLRLFRVRDLSIKISDAIVLVLLLTISIVFIELSSQSIDVLKRQLNDPFNHWVNIPLDAAGKTGYGTSDKMKNYFQRNPDRKEQYGVEAIGGYERCYRSFASYENAKIKDFKMYDGRSLLGSDRIVQGVFKIENNRIFGIPFYDDNDCGIIITESMAKKLGVDSTSRYIYQDRGDQNLLLAIPLRGIVKILPSQAEFLMTNHLISKYRIDEGSINIDSQNTYLSEDDDLSEIVGRINELYEHDQKIKFIISCVVEKSEINKINSIISDYLSKSVSQRKIEINNYVPLEILSPTSRMEHYWEIRLNLSDKNTQTRIRKIYQLIDELKKLNSDFKNSRPMVLSAIDDIENISTQEFSTISVYLSDLSKIDMFNEFIKNEFDVNIQIETIMLFNSLLLTKNIAMLFNIFIIILSILSSSIFVVYLIQVHLRRNSYFYGLLSAFGTSKDVMIRFYLFQSVVYIGFSILIALILSILFKMSFINGLFLDYISTELNQTKEGTSSILSIYTLALLVLTYIISVRIMYKEINEVINNSPSDLLNKRIG